jgi:MFS family permease
MLNRSRTPLPRPVRLLGWVSLLTDAATEAVYPLLPVFITQVLGGPPVALGIVEGAADATSSALRIVSGRWSDRIGRRKPLAVAGYALSSAVRPFIAVTSSWTHVFLIRVADRVGKGVRSAPRDAMLASLAPPGELGRVFGYHWAMDHAGAAIGPLLATAFLWFAPDSYRLLFALTIIPGALAVATLLRVPESEPKAPLAPAPSAPLAPPAPLAPLAPTPLAPLASQAPLAPLAPTPLAPVAPQAPLAPSKLPVPLKRYLWVMSIFMLGNSSDAFLLLQLSHAGAPMMGLTLLWSAQHAIKAMLATWGGHLSDRAGRRTLIVGGWLIYSAVYAGFAWSTSLAALVGWFLIYSVYAAAVEGSEKALVADLAPKEQRATAFGWYAAVQGFGALGASLSFGAIWQVSGAPAAFLTGAALALVAALLLATGRRS